MARAYTTLVVLVVLYPLYNIKTFYTQNVERLEMDNRVSEFSLYKDLEKLK